MTWRPNAYHFQSGMIEDFTRMSCGCESCTSYKPTTICSAAVLCRTAVRPEALEERSLGVDDFHWPLPSHGNLSCCVQLAS